MSVKKIKMNKYAIEIKWSIIFAVVYLLWLYVEKFLGFHSLKAVQEPIFNLLFIPISVLIIFLGIKEKKKVVHQNTMEWKEGFASGIILSLLVSVTTTLVVYVFFTTISPDFFELAIAQTKKTEAAKLSFNLPTFIKNNIFDKLSFGVVIAAIMSFVLKTK